MSDNDEKVLSAVEEALKKNPKASVDELFQLALGVNKAVAGLSKRQFHARYPLQVKRKLRPRRTKAKGAPSKAKGVPRKAKGVPRKAKGAPRKAKGVPRKAKGVPRPGRKAPPSGSPRDAVRETFLKFASDVAAAEARKDLVRVVAGVDRYVDEVLKATGKR